MRFLTLFALLLSVVLPLKSADAPPAKPWEKLEGCTYLKNPTNDGDSFHVRSADGREFIFRLYFVDCPESDDSFPDRVEQQAAALKLSHQKTNRARQSGRRIHQADAVGSQIYCLDSLA